MKDRKQRQETNSRSLRPAEIRMRNVSPLQGSVLNGSNYYYYYYYYYYY